MGCSHWRMQTARGTLREAMLKENDSFSYDNSLIQVLGYAFSKRKTPTETDVTDHREHSANGGIVHVVVATRPCRKPVGFVDRALHQRIVGAYPAESGLV